jgi:hypothetical protein
MTRNAAAQSAADHAAILLDFFAPVALHACTRHHAAIVSAADVADRAGAQA